MQSSENCCYSQSYKKSDNFVSEMKTEHQNKHILYGINEVAEVKSFTEKTIKEYVAQMQFSKLKGVLPGKKSTEKEEVIDDIERVRRTLIHNFSNVFNNQIPPDGFMKGPPLKIFF